MTAEDVLAAVNQYHYNGSTEIDDSLALAGTLGNELLTRDDHVRVGETEIGNFIAQCPAEVSAPIAVVNGGGIRASFYQGAVYGEDLAAVCPPL